jgi:hypothetical protein
MQQGRGLRDVTVKPTLHMLRCMNRCQTPGPAAAGRRAARRRCAAALASLLVVESGDAGAADAAGSTPTAGTAAFVAAWRHAVAQPGAEAIADLTAFPFLFEGRPLNRSAFVARVAPALFKPAVRRCLQRAQPQSEDGRLIVTCAPHGYVFGPTPSGWRLIEFFVDTP